MINLHIEGITITGFQQHQRDSCFWECKITVASSKKEYTLDIPISDFSTLIGTFISDNGSDDQNIETFLSKFEATEQNERVKNFA